jgi:uncharacterized protein (TIGR03083 family)
MTTLLAGPSSETLCRAVVDASTRLASLLRQVQDVSAPAVGVWNVGETAAHVAGAPGYFLAAARGVAELAPFDPEGIAAANARFLEEEVGRDPLVLADRLEQGASGLVAYALQLAGDPLTQPFAGVEVPLSTTLAIVLSEVLVHGWDIARGARLPWRIEPEHAALTATGTVPLLPFLVDPQAVRGLHLRSELRIRHDARIVMAIDDGTLRVEPPSAVPVDVRLSVEPVAYLLVTFGRLAVWHAMLQGKMVAWGRRPWRAGELGTVFMTF